MATITPMPQVPANVKLVRKGDVDTFEFGLPALDKFTIDYTGIPEEKRSGIARALLSASALSCYVGTLSHTLKAKNMEAHTITAEAKLELNQNEMGQNQIEAMKIQVTAEIDKTDEHLFDECTEFLQNGCFITASIHDGIRMEYNLTTKQEK